MDSETIIFRLPRTAVELADGKEREYYFRYGERAMQLVVNGRQIAWFVYDEDWRLLKERIYGEPGVTLGWRSYRYDGEGRLSQTSIVYDDRTLTVRYSYNEDGDLAMECHDRDGKLFLRKHFFYNRHGKLSKRIHRDGEGNILFYCNTEYSRLGKKLAVNYGPPDGEPYLRKEYAYDDEGRVILQKTIGRHGSWLYRYTYSEDENTKEVHVEDPDGRTWSRKRTYGGDKLPFGFAEEGPEPLTGESFHGAFFYRIACSYDREGRLWLMREFDERDKPVRRVSCSYDSSGAISSQREEDGEEQVRRSFRVTGWYEKEVSPAEAAFWRNRLPAIYGYLPFRKAED